MDKAGIYLDNAATSLIDPEVLKAMVLCRRLRTMNASSSHKLGVAAAKAIEKARATIAAAIHAEPEEIIFTSGGTESNNLALQGVVHANQGRGKHIILSKIEHASGIETAKGLERRGFEVTFLPADGEGFVSPRDVEMAIKRETLLVSVIHGNNEIGTIEPVEEIGSICKSRKVYFHSDACQSLTRTEVNVRKQNLDLVSLNAHKIHGPKGVGALYVRKGVNIEPLIYGGGQESGLRPGTYNTEGIVGFGKAVEIAKTGSVQEMTELRDYFVREVKDNIEEVDLNGPEGKRLCNNISLRFRFVSGQSLSRELSEKNIYVSTGSACLSKKVVASHVLLAIGLDPERAQETIRISLSKWTTRKEVDLAIRGLREAVRHLRRA